MRFSLASVALVHRVEGGPAIAAHSPGPETHCVYERIASRRQANRITEAESHEGAHGNRITESQILRFGSTKGLKSQILESHVRFKQSQHNRRNRHKNDDLCDSMHKNEHSRHRTCGGRGKGNFKFPLPPGGTLGEKQPSGVIRGIGYGWHGSRFERPITS